MHRLGVAESAAIEAAVQTSEKKNASCHSHYSQYYDDELRELIGERERDLIATYGYTFEQVESTAPPVTMPAFYSLDVGFRKLLDRERSFLLLRSGIDIAPLRQKVEQISDCEWAESGREKRFHAHRNTQSLILVNDNFRHVPPTYSPSYSRFEPELRPLLDSNADYYGGEGMVLRALRSEEHPSELQ